MTRFITTALNAASSVLRKILDRSALLKEYGVAIGTTVAALLVRFSLDPYLEDHLPYITFFIAVAVTTWYGGLGASLLAVILGGLASNWSFMSPRHSFYIVGVMYQVGYVTYFMVSLAFVALGQALRRARLRTERANLALRQNQNHLRLRSEQFETLVNQAPLGVYLVDGDFRIAQVNPTARQVFGNIPDLLGRDFEEVMHALWHQAYADEIVAIYRHTLETGEPYVTPERIEPRLDRGDIERYEWRIDRIVLPDGRFGIVCYFRDISSLVQSREALRELNEGLEHRVEERTEELLQSQQRLRTLATELSLTEQRERKRLATELHDHLQQMLVLAKLKLGQSKRFANHVPALAKFIHETDDTLSDALKYTRTLVTELSPPVLRDHGLCAGLKWLGEYMKNHNLAVTVTLPEWDGVDAKLREDQSVLLFQSVRELLINSSKHAGTHGAWVTIEERQGHLAIEVRDKGAGFDLAVISAAAESPNGGLSSKFGLFSIRERMTAIGGSFEIHSAPGEGTTAVLTVPTNIVETKMVEVNSLGFAKIRSAPGPSVHLASTKVRVLVVDDHAMVRQGLRSILSGSSDLEIVGESANGVEALCAVEQHRPAVVLMDINMPDMDGIEATARIKSRYPDVAVIGLSVNAGNENQHAMLKAGAEMLLTKEAAVEQLYGAIQEVMKMKKSLPPVPVNALV
jgi:PAS domain S-box-containing protein